MKRLKIYVRELREKAGLSRPDLARLTGYGVTAITKIERGERKLHEESIRRIAAALEVYPADLFDGGPERLRPRARAVVEIFEGLNEERQDAFYKGLISAAQPAVKSRPAKKQSA